VPKSLTPADWKVMKIVWRLKSCAARDVYKEAGLLHGLSRSATKTLLHRLVDKRYLSATAVGTSYLYRPVRPAWQSIAGAADTLLENTPDGMGAARPAQRLIRASDDEQSGPWCDLRLELPHYLDDHLGRPTGRSRPGTGGAVTKPVKMELSEPESLRSWQAFSAAAALDIHRQASRGLPKLVLDNQGQLGSAVSRVISSPSTGRLPAFSTMPSIFPWTSYTSTMSSSISFLMPIAQRSYAATS
jgi:predicted transcriptional regulator